MNNSAHNCPKCGVVLTADTPSGHCPKCLLQLAVGAEPGDATLAALAEGDEAEQRVVGPVAASTAGASDARPLVRYMGDYELQHEIARGGMGVVWKARQVSLNRPVAIKMILAGRFAGSADVKRFHSEAEAAANLQHPNIVAIHEVGEQGGQHYFSMEYIEGRNLAELANEQSMPAVVVAALVKTIAEAIHFAHQRGTLHRDLKPSNVLIDAAGQPHITDFGLAKQLTRNSGLTEPGAVMGTPAYMPPEQAAGRNAQMGPASDVYSIGAILYHLLTGRAPFVGETPAVTMRKVMEEEAVAPSKLVPGTPPDLEIICLKCLEKQVERRYHSARDLAEELSRFLNHEPILAKPASATRKAWSWVVRSPWAMAGAASVFGIVLLGLVYGLWQENRFLLWKSLHPREITTMKYLGWSRFWPEASIIGWQIMIPAILCGRVLKDRARRNLAMSRLEVSTLALCGWLLVGIGLFCSLMLVHYNVWKMDLPWLTVVGICLGAPLLFCWTGGTLIWQAVCRHQAHCSGSVVAEQEWLPRQGLVYSSLAFMAATLVNLLVFTSITYLIIPPTSHVLDDNVWLRMCFVVIALIVTSGCWEFWTRKLHRVPKPVSLFVCVTYAGAVLVWFSVLQVKIVAPAILAGMLGGLILSKIVKIGKAPPAEKLSALRFNELFECDRPLISKVLAGALMVVFILAGLVFHGDVEAVAGFVVFSGANALWPVILLAWRTTTGKLREFFLALAFPMLFLAFTQPMIWHGKQHAWWMLGTVPVGIVIGCLLIQLGRIRPKAR